MAASPPVSFDTAGLGALRRAAAQDPKAAVRDAARQFEALFMQELMKTMRQATPTTGLFENDGTRMGREMLDTQFAQQLAGRPGGLAEVIARQLERSFQGAAATPAAGAKAAAPQAAVQRTPLRPPASAEEFVGRQRDAALAAQRTTGIPAGYMIAQAAHETGWGRHEIRMADGSNSFNVFGIKAGAGWKGATTEVRTTEFVDGEPRKVVARFRAYASYDEAYADYARLMRDNPRYAAALAAGGRGDAHAFASGLQRAGYASDPAYAAKLARVIDATERLARRVA